MASTLTADNGSTSGSSGLKWAGDASGVLNLQSGSGVTGFTLDINQNVGIGGSPSAWSTSGYPALQLKSGGSFWSTSANGTVYSQNTYFNGTNQIYLTTNPATYYQQYNGTHIWQYAASGTAGNAITFTQGMTLDANGNLGLGVTPSTYWTTTLGPVFQFGTGYSFLTSQGSLSAIYFGTNAYYNSGWKYGQSGQASLYEQYQGSHSWYNATSGSAGGTISGFSTAAMTLDNSGRLLVGNGPNNGQTYNLGVYKASSQVALLINADNGYNSYINFSAYGGGISFGRSGGTGNFQWNSANDLGGTQWMTLDNSGSLLVGSTSSVTSTVGGHTYQRLGGNTVLEGSSVITVSSSAAAALSRPSGIGGIALLTGYNTSSGAQGTWIVSWNQTSGVSVVSAQNGTGLTINFTQSGGTLYGQTSSGSIGMLVYVFTYG